MTPNQEISRLETDKARLVAALRKSTTELQHWYKFAGGDNAARSNSTLDTCQKLIVSNVNLLREMEGGKP